MIEALGQAAIPESQGTQMLLVSLQQRSPPAGTTHGPLALNKAFISRSLNILHNIFNTRFEDDWKTTKEGTRGEHLQTERVGKRG